MLSKEELFDIAAQISIGDLELLIRYDGERPYMQIRCEEGIDTVTGEVVSWTSRKWMLSPHMCRTEVVRTAYKAYIAAIMHEAQETFKYKDVAIFDPHYDVEALIEAKRIDARVNGMQGV